MFRELLPADILSEDEVALALEMTDRRNDTVHTYKEAMAQLIFSRIPDYIVLMKKLLSTAV